MNNLKELRLAVLEIVKEKCPILVEDVSEIIRKHMPNRATINSISSEDIELIVEDIEDNNYLLSSMEELNKDSEHFYLRRRVLEGIALLVVRDLVDSDSDSDSDPDSLSKELALDVEGAVTPSIFTGYTVVQNSAAGYAHILERGEYGNTHDDIVGTFSTRQQAHRVLDELAGPTAYAVFRNRGAGDAFISEENHLSGNWKGSKYGHYNFSAEFASRKEAEEYLQELAGPTVYAIFRNRAAGDAYISEENSLSGNWKGSKHGHYEYCGHYATLNEAKDVL